MITEQIKYAEILGIETEIKELISSEIYDREQIDVLLLARKTSCNFGGKTKNDNT